MAPKKPVSLLIDPQKATVSEVQELLKAKSDGEGVICPCCRQVVVLEKVPLTSSMCYMVMLFYAHYKESGPVIPTKALIDSLRKLDTKVRFSEWPRLSIWGIISTISEGTKKQPPKDKHTLTARGIAFAETKIELPAAVFMYTGKVVGFSSDNVNIIKCLGTSHDYSSLLAGKFVHLGV